MVETKQAEQVDVEYLKQKLKLLYKKEQKMIGREYKYGNIIKRVRSEIRRCEILISENTCLVRPGDLFYSEDRGLLDRLFYVYIEKVAHARKRLYVTGVCFYRVNNNVRAFYFEKPYVIFKHDLRQCNIIDKLSFLIKEGTLLNDIKRYFRNRRPSMCTDSVFSIVRSYEGQTLPL